MLLLRAILLIVLALSSLFFAGLNILWIAGEAGKVAPTTKSMHLVHLDDSETELTYHKPRSYFTLDWLMRPASVAPFKDAKFTVSSDLCYNEEENCSPQPWQTSKFCFYGHEDTNGTQWLSNQHILHTSFESVSQQIFGRSDEDDKNVGGFTWAFDETNKYVVTMNNGIAAKSTCQNTRLNSAKVIINDPNVWSLASMHSPFVLLCFIYFIFFLLALFEIYVDEYSGVEWHKEGKEKPSAYFSFLAGDNAVNYYDFAVVAVLAVIIVAKMQTAGIMSEMSTEYARAHPNGSYLYGVGMLIVFAYYAHNRIKREKEHAIKKNYKQMNKVSTEASAGVIPDDAATKPLTWNLQTFGSNGSTLKTNAQLMNVSHASNQTSIKIDHEPMLHSGCIVVFCVLPLWILVAYIVGNGFVLDCNLQALFLAGFVYALVDMYGTFLSESLHLVVKHSNKSHDLFQNPLTGTTVYMLVIQIITVIFINVVLMTQNVSVAVSTSTDDDQTDLRVTLSQISIWLLNIYFVFNALEKVLRLYFSDRKPIRVFNQIKLMAFETSDELLLFVFVALVFLHGIIIMASYTSSAANYLFRIDADLSKELSTLSTNFVKEKMLWAASWTQL